MKRFWRFSLDICLPVFVSSFVFFVNVFLFYLYKSFPGMHPDIFLFDVNLFWLGPIVFVLVNAIVLLANYMVLHVIVKSISLSRMILGEFVIGLNFLLSLFLLPFSLSMFIGYVGVSLMYFLILLVRLMDPFLTEIGDAKVGEDVLKLLHSQWLEFLRISLWGILTTIIGSLSAAIAFISSTGVLKLGGTLRWGYPMGQMIYIGVLMMYGAVGIGLGITYFYYSVLLKLRKCLSESHCKNR